MAVRDQRTLERCRVRHEIDVARGDERSSGFTEDLTQAGAQVRAVLVGGWKVGETVELSFQLPDLEVRTVVLARVRWVSAADPDYAGLHFAAGLRAREVWALRRWLGRERLARTG